MKDPVMLDKPFFKYFYRGKIEQFLHTLEGIIKGIAIDHTVTEAELKKLRDWCDEYPYLKSRSPFKEMLSLVEMALEHDELSAADLDDIMWLCNNLRTKNSYFNAVTSDLQRLEGILRGIMADKTITHKELKLLQEWLDDNRLLKGCYPYDELESVISSVLHDRIIDDHKQQVLQVFFSGFINESELLGTDDVTLAELKREISVLGVCSINPEIIIPGHNFAFTGPSLREKLKKIIRLIEINGGSYQEQVNYRLNYLIVTDGINPIWPLSCFGRKIERAIRLRKQGRSIVIAHEDDFFKAISNA